MNRWKDLLVWRKSHELVLLIYNVVGTFPKNELENTCTQTSKLLNGLMKSLKPKTDNKDYYMQNQFNVEYPQNLPDLLQVTKQAFEDEARMAMAVKLFELKRLSSGMAAELAGCSRVAFLLALHRFNVPMIDLEEEELLSDMENA